MAVLGEGCVGTTIKMSHYSPTDVCWSIAPDSCQKQLPLGAPVKWDLVIQGTRLRQVFVDYYYYLVSGINSRVKDFS